jgi:hypothetical protein
VNSKEISESDAVGAGSEPVEIGTPDHELHHDARHDAVFLRGLKPGTSYDARFVAKNADGEAEVVIPFKTLEVEKPEIDVNYSTGWHPQVTSFEPNGAVPSTDTAAGFVAKFDANGAESKYSFEYAPAEVGGGRPSEGSASWKPFTSGASGTIGVVEEYAWAQAGLAGLKPETTYYVRVGASNTAGESVQTKFIGEVESFTTLTAKPGTNGANVRNVTGDSAYVHTNVRPHGSETAWSLEYTTEPGNGGSWRVLPGGSGTVSRVQAEAMPYGGAGSGVPEGVRLTGLGASSTYYVRATATNTCVEGCGGVTSEAVSFTTSGAPSASVFGAHGLVGGSLRLLGSVASNSVPTSAEQVVSLEGAPTGGTFTLTFEGHTTTPIAYDASAEAISHALSELEGEPPVEVEGPDGGPYTVSFYGNRDAGVSEPQIEGDGSGLTPAGGSVKGVTSLAGGVAYDTHYHFEYVSQKSFAEHGWAEVVQGAEGDAGLGGPVGYDLPPGLVGGETYRYRLVAQSDAPGTGPVESAEGSLTVPVPVAAGVGGAGCGNEALRGGLSAHLPDCRSYELLTPAEKEGAQEPFHYGGTNIQNSVLVGEDGDHVLFQAEGTDYRKGAFAGQSPYLFSREPGAWSMIAGLAQPEAGVDHYTPQVFSGNATEIALASEYQTSGGSKSADVEYKVGPVGGPYRTVVSVPRAEVSKEASGEFGGWVAGDPSLSKLVLATEDHELLGEATGTKSGLDLYEYTPSGGLAQLNVNSEGTTIGSCGAQVVKGYENGESESVGISSSQHSVSVDGSRVFFVADPGRSCGGEPAHLFMRVNGAETVDIGAYTFLAANAQGTSLLLESEAAAHEVVLYDSESGVLTPLPGSGLAGSMPVVAADLSAAYYIAGSGLYRYDIPGQKLEFLMSVSEASSGATPAGYELTVSPDGRYVYFHGAVGGLPGDGIIKEGSGKGAPAAQLYRYDSGEHAVECVSCASSFDPEPRLSAFLNGKDGKPLINGAMPLDVSVAGNGDYAFFTTPAALVPEDNDGEIGIEVLAGGEGGGGLNNGEYVDSGNTTSPSSDIYEWRADGVHGCAQLNGCVALITAGHGGYQSLLLGSTDEGEDVFIYTHEKLVSQVQDTSGNIYDVRVGGGYPPPAPRPTECEADACSTPPSAPNDSTPASLTFTGVGNVLGGREPGSSPAPGVSKAKAKKPKKAKGKKEKGKKRGGAKVRRKRSGNRAKKSMKGSK